MVKVATEPVPLVAVIAVSLELLKIVHVPAIAVGSEAPAIFETCAVKVKLFPSVAVGELVVTVTAGAPLLTVISEEEFTAVFAV